jgi:hypothetical protein
MVASSEVVLSNRIKEIDVCTNCLTTRIRVLVEPKADDPYSPCFTLRAGHGLGACGLLIAGSQDEFATFDFTVCDEKGGCREATPDDDPSIVTASVYVLDPIDWAVFLTEYARSQGKDTDDYYDLVTELEAEALALFPRLPDLMKESEKEWGIERSDDEQSQEVH